MNILNTDKKMITVGIPAYKAEDHIRDCLSSIMIQTVRDNVTVIIGKDNPSDNYDFSDWTDEELEKELVITQLVSEQIDRMIAENERQIELEDDVDGRTRLIAILTAEKEFKTDKINALNLEIAKR